MTGFYFRKQNIKYNTVENTESSNAIHPDNADNSAIYTNENNDSEPTVVDKMDLLEHEQYYLLIPSVHEMRVYSSKKILANDLNDELMIAGAINYISANFPEKAYYKSGSKDTSSLYISVDVIKEYVKKLYDRALSNNLPEFLCVEGEQSCAWTLQSSDKYSYDCAERGCYFPFWSGVDKLSIYDKIDIAGDYTYLYDKALQEGHYDGGYGAITIGNPDSEESIMVETTDINEVFKQYPKYFNSYKHTFKNNADGTITYISTELIQ